MWTTNEPENCDTENMGKYKTSNCKYQTEGVKVRVNPFARALDTIPTNNK